MKRALFILAIALLVIGCHLATTPAPAPNTGQVSAAASKAEASIEAAKVATAAAKPHADATGKAILDVAIENQGQAKTEIVATQNRTAELQQQINVLSEEYSAATSERDSWKSKYEGSWLPTSGNWTSRPPPWPFASMMTAAHC